jgi:hypothetical protein
MIHQRGIRQRKMDNSRGATHTCVSVKIYNLTFKTIQPNEKTNQLHLHIDKIEHVSDMIISAYGFVVTFV